MLVGLPDWSTEFHDKLDKLIKETAITNGINISFVIDSLTINHGCEMISEALVRIYDDASAEDRKLVEESKKWFDENSKSSDKAKITKNKKGKK